MDRPASFSALLDWHLNHGTRPGGIGRRWTNKEFAAAVTFNINERSVRNWRRGVATPNALDHIEHALFGPNASADYAEFRHELRDAYAGARRELNSQREKPKPLQAGKVEKAAYLLAELIRLECWLLIGAKSHKNLLLDFVSGLEHVVDTTIRADIPPDLTAPLTAMNSQIAVELATTMFSRFMIGAVNYFDRRAPEPAAISFCIGRCQAQLADAKEQSDIQQVRQEFLESIRLIKERCGESGWTRTAEELVVSSRQSDATVSSFKANVTSVAAELFDV